ncbi:MAG: putative T7SS-secreted protein [Marmoricola sp.]
MTKRYGSWELLDHDDDPVPASESEVQSVANDMKARARAASDIHDTLQKLADLDGWKGKAAEAFGDKASEVLEDLGKVEDRYTKVAQALSAWAGDVGTARSKSWRALQDAEQADSSMRSHPDQSGGSGPMTPEQQKTQDKHDEAKDAVDAAKSALGGALSDLDDAADKAKGHIDDAADVWDDGMWGNFKGWVRDHAELIDILCKALAVIGAILGAILLVAVIFFTAPVWLVVAAIGGAVLLLAGHAMLVTADTGKATWGDVAWDIAGLALTCVGGRSAASALKGLTKAVPAMATRIGTTTRGAALTRLIGGNTTQFNNALKIVNPRNGLRQWTTGLVTAAHNEGENAAAGVRSLMHLKPSVLKSVAVQNRGLAKIHSVLGELEKLGPSLNETRSLNRIHNTLRIAITSNMLGTANYAKGVPKIPDTVGDIRDFGKNPHWSTQPTH